MLFTSKKKYLVYFLFAAFIGAGFVINLLLQKEDSGKSTDEYQQESVSKIGVVPSQSVDSVRFDSNLLLKKQEFLPPIEDDTDDTEKHIKEKVTSAIFGVITRQLASDEPSEEELKDMIGVLFDKEASLKDRRQCAWALAKNGDPEVLLELEKILLLQDTPGYLKAAIAEGLGYSSNPDGKKLILSALEDEDDIVVRGATRGLSAIGDRDAISILSNIVFSNEASRSVIAEAAAGLGKIDHPEAYNMLVDAYNDTTISTNTDFKENIIAALGQRDISETSEFFQKIVDENTTNSSLQLATIEAIQEAQGDTSSFLLNNLDDEDSEVRAEAAWALAIADEPPDIAEELMTRLAQEEDTEVRKGLYQALGNQENVDIDAVAEAIFEEHDSDARLAGYDFLAGNIGVLENARLREQFEKTAIPELQEIALSSERLNDRLSAVVTLKRANTAESFNALEEIASKSSDMKVVEATGIYR